MLPSRSGIFSLARRKLIKIFSIVFFHNTFIAYDGPKGNKQREKSYEQKVTGNK